MTTAAMIALGIGTFHFLTGLVLLLKTEVSRKILDAFPRNRISAIVLTAICLAWSAWLIYETPLGRFDYLKRGLIPVTIASFYLMVVYMDELLAPRALGGFLLLAGVPILLAVRWHDSPWRVLISLWVYAAAIKGMVLVLSPFRFRQAVSFGFANTGRLRIVQLGSLVFGALSIGAGLVFL